MIDLLTLYFEIISPYVLNLSLCSFLGILRQTSVDVGGSPVLPDHLGEVHHVGEGALAGAGALGLLPAVAGLLGGLAARLQNLLVVSWANKQN